MNSFLQSLSHLGSRLPEVILTVTILAVIMILLLTFLTNYAIKKAEKKGAPPPSKKEPKEETILEYKMPPIGGRISRYLTLRGIFRVGDISLSFLRALVFLRDRLDNITYKYQLPWYLMVGASNSGKSTLLEFAGMNLPVGMPDLGIKDPHPACRWWFFNRAVVLDIHGSLVIDEHKASSDERGWRSVLSLLGRYRAKRPLDGIILTIPATELYGRERLSPENINARAKFLSQKLAAAQHLLGLRLPVYVVVTKCDFLPGFQSFCHELPFARLNNMLGWSVPYALHTAYTPHWVDEAFHTIFEDMSSVQLEMFTQGVSDENKEGVYVLPNEFLSLKSGLKNYLNHIFKSSAYVESLMLRGIYFCGDCGKFPAGFSIGEDVLEEAENQQLKADLSLSTMPLEINEEALQLWHEKIDYGIERQNRTSPPTSEESQYFDTSIRKIAFGRDIFEDKIFFESGLAYPIYSRLVSANRNINLAKAGMVAFVGIGTFGMFNAYDNFTKNRDYLMPVLGKVSSILTQLPNSPVGGAHGTEALFDNQAKSLLEMMHHVHRSSFFSFFIPSSWFSPLQDHLNSSLKISYEQIILRTIYMDLLLKARDTLNIRPGTPPYEIHQKTTAIGQLLNPTGTVEFQHLKTYVNQIAQLTHHIDKYNRLRETPDPTLLNELIEYTFNMHLPPEFTESYQKFQKLLQEAPYPAINLKDYHPIAQSTFLGLYTNFLSILFSQTDPMSLIGQLRYLTTTLGSGQNTQPINLEVVRGFISDLGQSLPTLGSAGHNWIDAAYFDPGQEFVDLMTQVDELSPFGPAFVEQLAKQTSLAYTAFHQELLQMNRVLISLSATPSNKPIQPSEGIFNLEKNLSKLFAEPFMAKSNGEMFISQVPENKVIFWNQDLIDETTKLIKRYEDFVEKDLQHFPVQLRETFKQIALQNLHLNVISNIAKAQSLVDVPKGPDIGDAQEELLRSKIGNVKTIVPHFIKLLETLKHSQSGTIFVELQNLLGILATRLLEKVDALLISYLPYKVRENNFDWWDGKSPVFLEGFAVKDQDELKSYLDHQRQLISHLAVDYAQPILVLLTSPQMQGYVGKQALINRWNRIISQLSHYDKKQPNNSISALENFIEVDGSDLTMSNCFTKLSVASAKKSSNDFFQDRRIQLQRALMTRCEVAKRKESINNYEKLVEVFNTTLKDKFPFVGENASQSQGEADPADIKNFFTIFHDAGDSAKNILEQVYQLGDAAKEPYQFLTAMEGVREFFQNFLNSKTPGDVPTFDFSVDFRVNKEKEIGGNMIIEWAIAPDANTKISNTDKSNLGRWSYGNPVILTFRWPDSAETQPFQDKAQPFMAVNEQTVTYTYPGQWALFWMLRTQQATSSDFDNMQDTKPTTLKFTIPNGPDTNTIIFDRVTLLKPPKGKKPGAPLEMPNFPTDAPALDQSIQDVAEKPVIIMGQVEISPEIKEDIESKEKAAKGKKDDKKKSKSSDDDSSDEAPADDAAAKNGKAG